MNLSVWEGKMKHSAYVFFAFMFFYLLGCSKPNALNQQGWFWSNPLPQGNMLNDVFFFNANTGTAVGMGGTILHTIDGGLTWICQSSGITNDLNGVFFVDAKNGIVAGDGIILSTTDGGNTWTSQTSGITNGISKTIQTTTDGGKTWSYQFSGTGHSFTSVFFTDSKTGTVVGSGGSILRTTNGSEK